MEMMKQKIEKFFSEYAARFNRSLLDPPEIDAEGVTDSFSSFIVGANPLGVAGAKNDEQFRARIIQGFRFYKGIGTTSMKVASLDITPLDELHAMVKVHWDSRYRKKDDEEERIEFDVIYLLQLLDGRLKIFAYITGDEQKVLRERGLIPG
jgi:hypothetical protein